MATRFMVRSQLLSLSLSLLVVLLFAQIVRADTQPQALSAQVTMTVGFDGASCGASSTITVAAGTQVYFCISITNNGDVTIATVSFQDTVIGLNQSNVPFNFAPGQHLDVTDQLAEAIGGNLGPVPINADTTNTLTYSAVGADGSTLSGTASATIIVEAPAVTVVKTVGTAPDVCATTTAITVAAGTQVYYCFTVTNTGNVVIATASFQDASLGLDLQNQALNLEPSQSRSFVGPTVPQLGPVTINADTTNTLSYSAVAANGTTLSGSTSATVTVEVVETPAVTVVKTVGTAPDVCATTTAITVAAGTQVYYCFTVTNTGNVVIATASFEDPTLGLNFQNVPVNFQPGQSQVFVGPTVPQLGPVTINADTTNTLSYSAVAANGTTLSGSTSATVTVEVVPPDEADLSITKTDSPDPVTAGDLLTYTLTISNVGPDDAINVIVTDTLPTAVIFITGTFPSGTCAEAAGVVTCTVGTISSGSTLGITLTVATTTTGVITNVATVASDTADPNETNNSDVEQTTVRQLPPPTGNLITNPGFEAGVQSWKFYTDGQGNFSTGLPAFEGSEAAQVAINQSGSNIQLYQHNISLEPNTEYVLRFAALSTTGHDLRAYIHKHGEPYTHYGLNGAQVDLTTGYQIFEMTFTTKNFNDPVSDGRLRFWLAPYAQTGDVYRIDDVSLRKVSDVTAPSFDAVDVDGSDSDDAGRLAGGAVPEDDSTAPQRVFMPLIVESGEG